MLNVKKFIFNPFQENTYIISDDTKECAIIDCGAFDDNERSEIKKYIADNDLDPVRLICTHAHFDHCVGVDFIHVEYGLHAEVSEKDNYLVSKLPQQAMAFLGIDYNKDFTKIFNNFKIENDIYFGSHSLKILETPGHSKGSVTFYCEEEKTAFTGDTLFRMGMGRTDLGGGSMTDIMNSLRNVLGKLPKETVVMSGHGGNTTIGYELAMNPYLM